MPETMPDLHSPWRADFPQLRRCTGLHYLDSAATALKPDSVIDACTRVMAEEYGPIHRGLYPAAERATDLYESARATLCDHFAAGESDQLIFTRSATESINMIAQGWLAPRLKSDEEVWVTELEHHANYLPWQRACQQSGARFRVLPVGKDAALDPEAIPPFTPRVKLLAVSAVSNVLGTPLPIEELCSQAKASGTAVLVDASQAVGHQQLSFNEIGCDFLVGSGHKMFGPTGIGFLLATTALLEETEPLLLGGGMVDQATLEQPLWAGLPAKLEAGSPNLVGAVGLAAAARYLDDIGRDPIAQHVTSLTRAARSALSSLEGVKLYGVESAAGHGIVSFAIQGVHPHDIGHVAGESGVAIRAGHHCCQPLMRALGVDATARVSLALYNDSSDIDALVAAAQSAIELFGGAS